MCLRNSFNIPVQTSRSPPPVVRHYSSSLVATCACAHNLQIDSCDVAEQLFASFMCGAQATIGQGEMELSPCSQLSRSAPLSLRHLGCQRGGCLTMPFTHFAFAFLSVEFFWFWLIYMSFASSFLRLRVVK
ncbi:hypothetical protein V8E52_011918 [Russula decolorans]